MQFLKVYFFQNLNFGDALNTYILGKLSKKPVVLCHDTKNEEHYMAIGSIANWATSKSIVWGTGIASREDKIPHGAKILMTRGPLTAIVARQCGYDEITTFGDPALVLPRLYNPKIEKKFKVGFIPHYTDMEFFFNQKENLFPEYKFINVFDHTEKVIGDILSCEKIVSSSLHGLIVADAYGIPNLYCKMDNKIGGDGMKYDDHFQSVGILPYKPFHIESLLKMSNVDLFNLITDRKPQIDIDKMLKCCPFYVKD